MLATRTSLPRFLLLASCLAAAFAKEKPILPPWILNAHTVAVIIDPDAGISLNDPNANQVAQRDVEAALLNWGQFTTVLGPEQADLVIVLRRGHGKLVEETAGDPRQNSRPGSVTRTDDGISIGAQHGNHPPDQSGRPDDGASAQQGSAGAHPQLQVGSQDDSFVVYEGNTAHPMDGPPGWRYVHKNGLHPHDVPAVAEFRKAFAEALKQANAKHP